MQRLLLTLAASAVAGIGLGAPAADAAAPTALSVVSPSDDSLETGTVDIKVHVPAGATKLTARVAGKDVALRGAGATRTASIPVASLRPGRATLAVHARGSNGKPLFTHALFTIGAPVPSLLKGRPAVTQAHGTAALKLDFKTKPTQVQVQLNGRRVPLLRTPVAGATTLPLAADDGLRFGANIVTVKAFDRRTGKWAGTTTRFTMNRNAPLASAGHDVRTTAGAKVKLSAAGSQARKGQLPLGYAWSIVSEPKTAKATLAGANTQNPTIKTTHPGRYRVQLQLIEHSRAAHAAAAAPLAQDVVTVDAAASIAPYGTPITTLVPNSDGSTRTTIQGIPLDGSNDYVDTPANMIGLIVLDRSTLGVDSVQQVNPDSGSVVTAVGKVTANEMGILTGAPGCCSWNSNNVGPIFKPSAGFTVIFAGGNYTTPIASNSGNMVVGSETSGPRTNGAMSGVLRKSHTLGSNGADVFTYAATDAVPFDTFVGQGNNAFNIQLGGSTGNFSGTGVGVVALGADLSSWIWTQWFPLTGDATTDATSLTNLTNQLTSIATNYPGAMMALQTNGSPKANGTEWAAVGDALTQWGGTSSVWNELDGTGNYALVGRAGAGATSALQETASAEASAPLTATNNNSFTKPTAGTLRGVIGRGPDALGIVAGSTTLPTGTSRDGSGNPVQVNPYAMTSLASAAPQPWPLSDSASTAALQWISQQLSLGDPIATAAGYCYQPTNWDLRAEYCNKDESDSWSSTIKGQMDALPFPSGQSFTQAQFNAVKTQLDSEFGMIAPVYNMIGTLQAPITNAQAQTAVDISSATTQVENSLSVTNAQSQYGMQSFVSDFLGPLQDLAEPEDATGFDFGVGLFASALDMALSSVTDDDGNPALDNFESNKTSIANDAVSRLTDASGQMALLEQMLLTDWTKLSTTAYYAKNVWSLSDWSAAGQTTAVESGTRAWLYKTMVPIAYSQIAVAPKGGNTIDGLHEVSCLYSGGNGIDYSRWPFIPGATPNFHGNPSGGTALPASAAFAPITGTTATGAPMTPFVWGLGNTTGKDSGLQTPSADLTDWLFKPLGANDGTGGRVGIGLYPEQFYSWGWVSANRYVFTDIEKQLGYPLSCYQ